MEISAQGGGSRFTGTTSKRETSCGHTLRTAPFAYASLGGLSAFAAHLVKLGITPERSAPGRLEQNGRLERFHRTLKRPRQPFATTLTEQQRAFDAFRRVYNEERPHETLGQRLPASHRRSPTRQSRQSRI